MASPGSVVIKFLVDAGNAARDAAGLGNALGKVEAEADDLDSTLDSLDRELDSVGNAARDLAHDMGSSSTAFDGVGDDAETAARRVKGASHDMGEGIRQGATDIDTETGHIRDSMKDAGTEAGAELIGNIAEGVGSGAASITETIQGTLGGITNLAASIGGPVGLAAGAAAAGIGLVYARLTADAERVKAQIGDIVGALSDLTETASDTAKAQIWDAWVDSLENGEETIRFIASGLREAGVSQGTFQDAIEGSANAQLEVRDAVQEQIDKLLQMRAEHVTLTRDENKRLHNLELIQDQLGIGNDALQDTKGLIKDTELLTGDSADAANSWAQQVHDVYNEAHHLNGELDEAARDRTSNVNVIVTMKDKNGRPVHLGPGQLSVAPPETVGVSTLTAPAPIVLPPVHIAVNLDQWGSARVTKRALEAEDRRQGRTPGRPLAVAW